VQALFAAADEDGYEDEDETGVLGSEAVASLKAEEKALKAEFKTLVKEAKEAAKTIKAAIERRDDWPEGWSKGDFGIGGTQTAPDLDGARRTLSIAEAAQIESFLLAPVSQLVSKGDDFGSRLFDISKQLAAHKALEEEAKALKAELRAAEKKREELVAAARDKITPAAARSQILARFRNTLFKTYRAYLEAERRMVTAAVENLHDKYAVTISGAIKLTRHEISVRHGQRATLVGLQRKFLCQHDVACDEMKFGHKAPANTRTASAVELVDVHRGAVANPVSFSAVAAGDLKIAVRVILRELLRG
jgi:hypothetical protein